MKAARISDVARVVDPRRFKSSRAHNTSKARPTAPETSATTRRIAGRPLAGAIQAPFSSDSGPSALDLLEASPFRSLCQTLDYIREDLIEFLSQIAKARIRGKDGRGLTVRENDVVAR